MIFINNIVPAESGSAVLMTQKGEKRKMTPVFLQDVLPRLAKKLTMQMIMMMNSTLACL